MTIILDHYRLPEKGPVEMVVRWLGGWVAILTFIIIRR